MKFNHPYLKAMAIGSAVLVLQTTSPAQTSTDALLNKLVEKGILTGQEAQDLKNESVTNSSTNPSGFKWKINDAIKSMELFGDFRLRYEYRAGQIGAGSPYAGDTMALNRWRYALRLGVRGDLADQFYYGFRAETSPNPRSPWNTFGGSSSGQSPYQGPFSKANNYSLFIGQAYLGWHPYDWLDLSAGRVPQPLYTTPMVWDSDYNPEGLVEKFKLTVGKADLFATFGQYIYEDINPSTGAAAVAPSVQNNPWLLTWQVGATYHVKSNLMAKIAPTLYNYVGHGSPSSQSPNSGFYGPFVGQGNSLGLNLPLTSSSSTLPGSVADSYNQTGINNLFVFELPAEVNFKLGRLDARLFGDFGLNFEGDQRARAAYSAGTAAGASFPGGVQLGQDQAYQVGMAVGNNLGLVYGQTARKGTWEARVYWQHVDQYSLDPNLLDSDFFEGRANMQGLYAAVAYSFTDAIIGTLRYGYAERIDSNLGTGGFNADLPLLNPVSKYSLVQVDMTLKF